MRICIKINSLKVSLPILVVFGFLISCYSNLTPTESKSISISLHFPSNEGNDPMVIAECLDSINSPDEFNINSKAADSTYGKFSYWYLSGRDSVYIIDIVYNKQKYLDTLILPNRIDSVFCNGTYMYNVLTDSSKIINIDTSSTYKFTWRTKQRSGYYYFEYQSNMMDSYFGGVVTTDTFFNVNRQNISDVYFDLTFQIRIWLSENSGLPYKMMNGISTFYQWESPKYINHFYVHSH